MEQTARVCNPEQADYLKMFAILPEMVLQTVTIELSRPGRFGRT
jgi:hypothetical protein